jgi:prevent-host-death family protein
LLLDGKRKSLKYVMNSIFYEFIILTFTHRIDLSKKSLTFAQLSALIEKVLAGEEVIIGKAGKPVARLVRYERSEEPRRPGALKGKIKIADDFDELPEDIAEAFGMTTS